MINQYNLQYLKKSSNLMSLKNIIIPARAGSKGWVRKNLKLFTHTADIIPPQYRKNVIVTTDDIQIAALCNDYGFQVHHRDESISQDDTDTLTTVKDVVYSTDPEPSDLYIMLYLTYPGRTWDEVQHMYNHFVSNKSKSMLCRQPVKTHPYLVMYPSTDNKGKLVIKHNKYQRQQYPECFEISHYMCMFRASELCRLGRNMYNSNTQYYSIDNVIDVDSETDYQNFINNEPENSN